MLMMMVLMPIFRLLHLDSLHRYPVMVNHQSTQIGRKY